MTANMAARAFRIIFETGTYSGRGGPALRLLTQELAREADPIKGTVELISVPQLASRIGLEKKQARRDLIKLQEAGDLEIEAQYAKPRRACSQRGRQLPNLYRLIAPWVRRQIEGAALALLGRRPHAPDPREDLRPCPMPGCPKRKMDHLSRAQWEEHLRRAGVSP